MWYNLTTVATVQHVTMATTNSNVGVRSRDLVEPVEEQHGAGTGVIIASILFNVVD